MDCCPLTLSFVGGPIETKKVSWEMAAVVLTAAVPSEPPAFASLAVNTTQPTYRGPPLNRRIERLKHCIIRI